MENQGIVIPLSGIFSGVSILPRYKNHFRCSGCRGIGKAINLWIIRLGTILSIEEDPMNKKILNDLYVKFTMELDLIWVFKPEDNTYMSRLIELIKASLNVPQQLDYIRKYVSLTNDNNLIFNI